ncbi:hypothetical protein BAA08_09580 [Bizionia sp. APA-3]|nr:hypothetical protein BAA08_09580 [Bizionia sp. APA-3]
MASIISPSIPCIAKFILAKRVLLLLSSVPYALMNASTFDKFFENDNGIVSNVNSQLHLNEIEMIIYNKINKNNWRLEQEKIPLEYVKMPMNSQR